ncbi:hypothetical protein [Prevotellamassilia timonensis]|uniref:hypothetical protein n=1 Tax=Prevotellamassilia timonensis TaxID=1852370 RepID=UPI00307A81D7
MKLTYITPASRAINFEPMQMLAASRKVTIVDDETKSIDPTTSFSEGKGWSSEGWDNED